jgi:predicted  nucleic acid-binding Zn-ribbon protein
VPGKTLFAVMLGFMLLLEPTLSSAQNPKLPPIPQTESPTDPAKAKLERDMAKKANEERQVALRRDTEKLFKLATELKDYVDKSNENVLSFDVVKKAEEIEKLAHSVKEKMKAN